jgi:hypothetical protein
VTSQPYKQEVTHLYHPYLISCFPCCRCSVPTKLKLQETIQLCFALQNCAVIISCDSVCDLQFKTMTFAMKSLFLVSWNQFYAAVPLLYEDSLQYQRLTWFAAANPLHVQCPPSGHGHLFQLLSYFTSQCFDQKGFLTWSLKWKVVLIYDFGRINPGLFEVLSYRLPYVTE